MKRTVFPLSSQQTGSTAVAAAIGKEPTDVDPVCCDDKGNTVLFIGLPGASSKAFAYNPESEGNERLSAYIMKIYSRLDRAIEEAVRNGRPGAEEAYSNGYALMKDPTARSLQLAVRQWSLKHERELFRVLQVSSSAKDREVASDALGYARQSREQILALVRGARDPDEEVRNNATRALGVLVRSKPALASEIAPDTFIEMLNSGKWKDRNKASSLLMQLTQARNSDLLAKIRSTAVDSLIEMASWRDASHAYFARIVLGRVAGLPEDRLQTLAWNGPVESIIKAVIHSPGRLLHSHLERRNRTRRQRRNQGRDERARTQDRGSQQRHPRAVRTHPVKSMSQEAAGCEAQR
jgi:hypothetical protein